MIDKQKIKHYSTMPLDVIVPIPFRPDFDHLWICQQRIDKKLFAFTEDQALYDPTSAAAIVLTLPDVGPADGHVHNVNTFGFSPDGDMWVGYADTDAAPNHGQFVAKLSESMLTVTAAVTPEFSFPAGASGVSSLGVNAIVFAPNGDMWIATLASTGLPAAILKYTAASIASPGTPSAAVVLHQTGTGTNNSVNDLCFDGAGNLWFTNVVAGVVSRLSASQLLTSNPAIVPDIVLTVGAYVGVTLDAAGNLWCGRSGIHTSGVAGVDMFAIADVRASGAPAPARTVLTPISTPGSAKLRFDRGGDLWVNTATGPAGYWPADTATSGAPMPGATLTGAGALTAPRSIGFWPA